MKILKRVMALILTFIMVLSVNIVSFANPAVTVKPVFSDLSSNVSEAAFQLGIITEKTDKTAFVTRKNMCRLLVRFYRASTGGVGITISESPFVDCSANEVIFCYENDIMDGISDVTFAPDYRVSREDACTIIVNAIKACSGNVIKPEKDYTFSYMDRAEILPENHDAVSYLTSIGVISGFGGYFYPKSYITFEQLSSVLVQVYFQIMLSKISINGTNICIGDSEEIVSSRFGAPSYRINDTKAGLSVWVYKNDIKNFFYVVFKDKAITEIFSNGSNFSYRGIKSGQPLTEVNFGSKAKTDGNSALYMDGYGTVEIGALNDEGRINYVHAMSEKKELNHRINSVTIDDDTKLLYDIISAERAKYNLKPFITNKTVATAARLHSHNMSYWNYLGYINKDGLSPFDRLKNKDLEFEMASENITCVEGSVVDIFKDWMTNPGNRSNILTDYMDNVGIGFNISSSNGKINATMDVLKPVEK